MGAIALGTVVLFLAASRSGIGRSSRAIVLDLTIDGGRRVIEPRLSGAAAYASFAGTPGRKLIMTSAVRRAMHAEPALASLLSGEWSKAVELLQRSAKPQADIAAAYYMRGLATDSLLDFCRALEALREADPSADVLFNRALILQQLGDREAATATWRQYLALDNDSGWAAEARRHLQSDTAPSVADGWLRDKNVLLDAASSARVDVVRELAKRYPLGARRMVELELLPGWGEAVSSGNRVQADRLLNAAKVIVAQRAFKQERLLEQAIQDIEAAKTAGDAAALARAYALSGQGNKALDASDNDEARKLFARASALAGARSPAFDGLMIPNIVTAHYRRYEHAQADALIATARSRYAGQREQFIPLYARLDWLSGLIAMADPRPSDALRSYQSALGAYEKLGETEYVAAQHINQADSYFYLGDYNRAGAHVRKALLLASNAEDPKRLHGILKVAAKLSLESAGPSAAVIFQDRLVRMARAGSDRMRVADALVSRSSILVRAERRDDALRDLDDVRRITPSLPDGPTRDRLEADASAVEAFAFRDRDDRRVLVSLSRALDLYGRLEMGPFLVQLLLERGRTHVRLGDTAAAERDFREGIALFESQRARVDDAALRIAYFDRADRVFVDLAALLLSRGRAEDAFDLLERLRSRELLDQSFGERLQPSTLQEIRAALPANTVLVTHTVSASELLTFVVTHDGLRGFRTPSGDSVVGPLVDRVSAAFEADTGGIPQETLRQLGELLVDGVAAPPGRRIVFVPDEVLYRVPFAALRTANGTYLVETHTIAVAPSATLLARHFAREAARPSFGARSVLAIGSSEQPDGFANLPPLARAMAEAKRVAANYSRWRVISGSDAGAASFLDLAGDYDVIHFSGHSVVDQRTPGRSALLVGANGRVTAAQIEAMNLSGLELIVLGGCETGLGQTHRGEGAMSLARAFIAAGVPTVVSAVAPIEDAASSRLLPEFHRVYARNLDAPAALREAQLRMLHSTNATQAEPARWSSFQVIQGSASNKRR